MRWIAHLNKCAKCVSQLFTLNTYNRVSVMAWLQAAISSICHSTYVTSLHLITDKLQCKFFKICSATWLCNVCLLLFLDAYSISFRVFESPFLPSFLPFSLLLSVAGRSTYYSLLYKLIYSNNSALGCFKYAITQQ